MPKKQTYIVYIRYLRTVEVEAETEAEAEQVALDNSDAGDIDTLDVNVEPPAFDS
jgi:hypothetical protein